jgi:hypothetical protein
MWHSETGGYITLTPILLSLRGHGEAERPACEIRLRAERCAGQILKSMEKAKGAREAGARGTTRSDDATASPKTLEQLGISKQQSSDWQKLADMPEAEFEAGLAEATSRQRAV